MKIVCQSLMLLILWITVTNFALAKEYVDPCDDLGICYVVEEVGEEVFDIDLCLPVCTVGKTFELFQAWHFPKPMALRYFHSLSSPSAIFKPPRTAA